jgi:TetR/AcrR family transcriptional repressor of nem operon
MPGGRPKEFDETEVLERAMQHFWSRGYEGAALADLLDAMGISRQSLYDTFGNKRQLFIRAIEHYRAVYLSRALALLRADGSQVENVKSTMRFFERLASDRRCRGCLVANALVEVAPHDEEIATLLEETLDLLEAEVRKALERARSRGELGKGKSPRVLSRALTNAMIGLAASGKLRRGPATFRDIYAGTLAVLD